MEKNIFMGKRKSLIEKVMGKLPDLVGLLGRGTRDSGGCEPGTASRMFIGPRK